MAQNRGMKKAADGAIGMARRVRCGRSFDELTDAAAVGERVGDDGACDEEHERIAAGSGECMKDDRG